MKLDINQVGKRWFRVTGEEIDVEASYVNGIRFEENWEYTQQAGYTVWDRIPQRKWSITGKGARKHRLRIIKALSGYVHFEGGKKL